MRTPNLGYASYFYMFVKRKKNRSGSISVVIAEKISGRYSELATIGIAQNEKEVEKFVQEGREWIERENQRRHPRLDLFGEERSGCEAELLSAEQMLSCISNITIDGADLILDRVFDNVGFNRIGDDIFRKLVKARLSYPASKAATVEYLKTILTRISACRRYTVILTSSVTASIR